MLVYQGAFHPSPARHISLLAEEGSDHGSTSFRRRDGRRPLQAYLDRIAAYDCGSTGLNSVVVLNPQAHDGAAAADARRAHGPRRGPLDGIPSP
jgi:hypothetical protein